MTTNAPQPIPARPSFDRQSPHKSDDLLVVEDFAAAELAVRGGADSSRIVVLDGQERAAALAAA